MVLILKSIPDKNTNKEVVGKSTDGGHVADGEVVFGETEEDAGFADAGVTNNDQLEEVVVARFFL